MARNQIVIIQVCNYRFCSHILPFSQTTDASLKFIFVNLLREALENIVALKTKSEAVGRDGVDPRRV